MPELQCYKSSITFHGFSEIWEANAKWQKLLWTCIMIASVAVLLMQLSGVAVCYSNYPKIVKMKIYTNSVFPPVTFCPVSWIDRKALERSGLDYDDIDFVNKIFFPRSGNRSFSQLEGPLTVEKQQMLSKRVTKRLGSRNLKELLFNISRKDADVMRVQIEGEEGIPIRKIVNAHGICYMSKAHQLQFADQIFVDYLMVNIRVDQAVGPAVADTIFVGKASDAYYPTAGYSIKPNVYEFAIELRETKVTQQSTRNDPCDDGQTMKMMIDCLTSLRRRACLDRHGCDSMSPDLSTNLSNLCGTEQCSDNEFDFSETLKICQKPCAQDIYSGMVVPTKRARNGTSIIRIGFADPLTSIHFEEEFMYDISRLVGDVGGILSLWCGGSIISLIQLVYIFLRMVVGSTRKKSVVYGIKDPSGASVPQMSSVSGLDREYAVKF